MNILEKELEKFRPIEALPDLKSAIFYYERFCKAISQLIKQEKCDISTCEFYYPYLKAMEKLKKRGVQIADLKHRIKDLQNRIDRLMVLSK